MGRANAYGDRSTRPTPGNVSRTPAAYIDHDIRAGGFQPCEYLAVRWRHMEERVSDATVALDAGKLRTRHILDLQGYHADVVTTTRAQRHAAL